MTVFPGLALTWARTIPHTFTLATYVQLLFIAGDGDGDGDGMGVE